MQIYFLVVFSLILVGLILTASFFNEKLTDYEAFYKLLSNEMFKFVIGIICSIVSIVSLFMVTPGDIFFIGDILPALYGLFTGSFLILEHFSESFEENRSWIKGYIDFVEDQSTVFGLIALVVAILHFIAPSAVIL